MLLPLGGSTLINATEDTEAQLLELTRLTSVENINAIIDSERTSANSVIQKSRRDFAALCHKLRIRCLILQRRALENYFSERAVRAGIGPGHRQLNEFGEPDWDKNDNVKIAREMTFDEVDRTDLGAFLRAV